MYTEIDDNDLTYFILYQLDILEKAIESFKEYVSKKIEGKEKINRLFYELIKKGKN